MGQEEKGEKAIISQIQKMQIGTDCPQGPGGDPNLATVCFLLIIGGPFVTKNPGIEHHAFFLSDDMQGDDQIIDIINAQRLIKGFAHCKNSAIRPDTGIDQAFAIFYGFFQFCVNARHILTAIGFQIFGPTGDQPDIRINKITGDILQ